MKEFVENSNLVSGTIKMPNGYVEKTLVEMGHGPGVYDDIKEESQKTPLSNLVNKILQGQLKPNFTVKIGDRSFECMYLPLRMYSKKFSKNQHFIELPPDKVSLETFIEIYEWMTNDEKQFHDEEIVKIAVAANFLKVRDLSKECWAYMVKQSRSDEQKAFEMLLHAHQFDSIEIETLLISGIKKLFLSICATKNFMDFHFDQVRRLLSSTRIGVNTESEVFYAVVAWLNFKWNERKKHTIELMKTVHFKTMAMTVLFSLHTKSDLPVEVENVLKYEKIKQKIHNAIQKIAYHISTTGTPPIFKRIRIYDAKCAYHEPMLRNSRSIQFQYQDFLAYLDSIEAYGRDHWKTLVETDQSELQSADNYALF